MIVAASLLKLKSGEGVVLYNPHRIMRQLGYYQGVARIFGDLATFSVLVAEKKLVGEGALPDLSRGIRILCPELGRARIMSPE